MSMHTSIKRALADPSNLPFEAAMSREQMREVEASCRRFGVNRRVVLLFATQDRDEMVEALHNLAANEEALMATLDLVSEFTQHCENLSELARSIKARVFVACHVSLGLSLKDTRPEAMQN